MKKNASLLLKLLLWFECLAWLILSVFYALRFQPFTWVTGGIAGLMLANGLVFGLFAGYFIKRQEKIFKSGLFAFLALNTVLTVTDQAGLSDYIILALNLLTIACFLLVNWPQKARPHPPA